MANNSFCAQKINITSDTSEWNHHHNIFKAEGHVRFSHTQKVLNAEAITLYFDKKNNKNTLNQFSAHGHVVITTPTLKMTGHQAIYKAKENLYILSGEKISLITENNEILTAHKEMRFWENIYKAEAEKKVILIKNDKKLFTDFLEVFFHPYKKGEKLSIKKAVTPLPLKMLSANHHITGNSGEYNAVLETALIKKNVHIIDQYKNILKCDSATINFKTNIATINKNMSSYPVTGYIQRYKK